MRKSKHSKFKNTGILFELLTRQITADILSGKNESSAKQILFKYFTENTELGKEYQLYNFLLNEKARDAAHAERIINVVLESRSKIEEKKLMQQKYELIREIKSIYPIESFLKANIKNYRTLASIYKIFENRSSTQLELKDMVQAIESINESLLNKAFRKNDSEEKLIEYYKKQTEDIRLLSYKIFLESVNNKYKNFNDRQKRLIREYILNISNTNALSKFISEEVETVKSEISVLSSRISDNRVVQIKLNEITKVLDRTKPTNIVKDNHVMTLLLSYELIKELNDVM